MRKSDTAEGMARPAEESLPLLLFLLLVPSLKGHAVEALAPIEVSAGKEVKFFNFSSAVVIPASDLNSGEDSLLATQLQNVPGLIMSQNGGPGGRSSFFLRGTESRHLAFTLDGLKINDTSNTDRQFDAAFLSTPFLKEINIYKGPQAVLFGSDSMGGLIDMVSRKGEDYPETRLSLRGGSFGTVETSLSTDWRSDQSGGTLTLSRFRTDGISRLNEKRFQARERDAADSTNLFSSSHHSWSPVISTNFLAGFIQGNNELDGTKDDNSFDESQNDQYLFQQKTQLALKKSHVVSLRNGLNRHQRSINTLSQGKQSFAGNNHQNEVLLRSNVQSLNFVTGVASEHEEFSQARRSFDTHSLFAQTSLGVSKITFQAGGRMEQHTRYGNYQTGSLGGRYAFDQHSFSFQYSNGYKAPSLYQLYGPPSDFGPVGNVDLVPESNQAWEALWNFRTDIWQGEVSLFQNRLSNLITYGTAGYLNQGSFIAEGVDVSASYHHHWYQCSSGFTHQRFRQNEDRILRRPVNSLKMNIAVFLSEQSEVYLNSRWFSSRWDRDENFSYVKLAPYEIFDLGYRLSLNKMDYSLQLKNIFNRDYEDLYGFGVLPRSLFAQVGLRF
jgi:vitamin B12 transporter